MKTPNFIERKVPLSQFTSFKVGGPADYFAQVGNLSELKQAVAFSNEHYLDIFVLGKGTNLLVSDKGFRGLVLKLSKEFARIVIEENTLVAGGGAQLVRTASLAFSRSLSGLEWAAGIPGTVGGAVKMNAGAHGFSISDIISTITVFDSDSLSLEKLRKEEVEFGYRFSSISNKKIILEAAFKLVESVQEEIKKKMESYFAERKRTQPLQQRTAGSVFKNPKGDFAGRLIEAAGLKGYKLGGAMVSEIHANFIVNVGSATAQEIYNLMRKIQHEVYSKFKVMLEPEIILLGEFVEVD
ncbi:MAG: UDP-N-acetylmuramate dehydrogenase [Actinobacteria bacterium]|nr:UDP-N-acetylmuramate dehydrogenase [Actinomycetota bacterium]